MTNTRVNKLALMCAASVVALTTGATFSTAIVTDATEVNPPRSLTWTLGVTVAGPLVGVNVAELPGVS